MTIGENPAQPPKEAKALPYGVWRGRLSMWYASQKQMAGILGQTLTASKRNIFNEQRFERCP